MNNDPWMGPKYQNAEYLGVLDEVIVTIALCRYLLFGHLDPSGKD